ncbi:MAG: CpsD/CapB family tyrosine-protein kinase [Terracidiphilus sp.]|jgi:capsular exopolysaccharide synthesis family protein
MSRIFDALQRSESERTDTDSGTLAQGPELLRSAEKRITSKWNTLTPPEANRAAKTVEPLEIPGLEAILGRNEAPAAGAAQTLPEAERAAILSRYPSLPVSLPSQSRLVCLTDREHPTAEAVRLLGVRLRDLRRTHLLKTILITSTIPREGKSTIAANLACALAYTPEERILLVEGDLRRPSLTQMFGLTKTRGISESIKEENGLETSVYRLEGAGLWILPAGSTSRNPLELLQSQQLPVIMDKLAAQFDWIVIDSPPALPLADTSVWMRLADGILLVTRQGTTEKQQLQKGMDAIDPQKLLGVLMNGTMASTYSGYYYRSSIPS